MARLLAKMVNAGLRVLITTHSDYLIKEVNCLLMASDEKVSPEIIAKLKIPADTLIKPDAVKLYFFKEDGVTEMGKDKWGFVSTAFDEEIDAANELQDRLASIVEGEE